MTQSEPTAPAKHSIRSRRTALIAGTAGLGAVVGGAFGLVVPTTYVSTTQLSVNLGAISAGALPNFSPTQENLAATYARLASSGRVARPVAESLGLDAEKVRQAIVGTQVPESGIVHVEAKASEPDSAVKLANAAADALITIVGPGSKDAEARLLEYRASQRSLGRAQAAARDASRLPATSATRIAAQATVASAKLKTDVLAQNIRDAQGGATPTVQVVTRAVPPTSDKRKNFGFFALLGLIAGALPWTVLAARRS